MNRKIAANRKHKYPLMMFVLCGVIPHVMLSLLQRASESGHWSPAEVETYANFFVCQWIPFWLVFLSYSRLQKQDCFSPVPTVVAVGILPTYLPRFDRQSVMAIALAVPLMVSVELSALLKCDESSANTWRHAFSADRGMLRAFFFWSMVFPAVIHISCEACTWPVTVVSPFQMLPIPGILLFDVFRHQKNLPPSVRSLLMMLAAVPPSLYLAAIGPMEQFQTYHLSSLGLGYALVFMLLILYNIDHWKRPK